MHKQLTCSMMSFVVFCFLYVFLFCCSFLFSLSNTTLIFFFIVSFSRCQTYYFEESSELINVGLVDPVLQVHLKQLDLKQLDLKQLEVLQIHFAWAMSLIKSNNLINIVNILVYDI